MKVNLTLYKLMVEKSLSVLFLKSFAENKRLTSNILYYIYIKKIIQ